MYIFLHSDTSIKNYYNGQVRILNEQNNDLLEMYLEQDWRPVCVNSSDVNQVFADCACRQMGYTYAESYRPYVSKYILCILLNCVLYNYYCSSFSTHQTSWKIDIQPVCSAAEGVRISYPCLTNCMNHSSYTSQLGSCDGYEKFVSLTCRK